MNVVKRGNPNAAGLPTRPAYERGVEAYLELAARIRTGNRLLATEVDALDPVLSPFR